MPRTQARSSDHRTAVFRRLIRNSWSTAWGEGYVRERNICCASMSVFLCEFAGRLFVHRSHQLGSETCARISAFLSSVATCA